MAEERVCRDRENTVPLYLTDVICINGIIIPFITGTTSCIRSICTIRIGFFLLFALSLALFRIRYQNCCDRLDRHEFLFIQVGDHEAEYRWVLLWQINRLVFCLLKLSIQRRSEVFRFSQDLSVDGEFFGMWANSDRNDSALMAPAKSLEQYMVEIAWAG